MVVKRVVCSPPCMLLVILAYVWRKLTALAAFVPNSHLFRCMLLHPGSLRPLLRANDIAIPGPHGTNRMNKVQYRLEFTNCFRQWKCQQTLQAPQRMWP